MTGTHFLKSTGFGIALALLVLVIIVAGEVAWLELGLPGGHRATFTPTNDVATGTDDRSTTISESYADFRWVSFTPSLALSALGLVGGFWWRSGRISR
jgi:hypothetical protein